MIQVNINEAKTHLSRLIARAVAGEEIILANGKTPVVKLIQVKNSKVKRKLGSEKVKFKGEPISIIHWTISRSR